MNNVQDAAFLKALDNERNKFYYARIIILDKLDRTIKSIEGRVQQGSSISINGSSSMRRTCNISLIAEDAENDLTNIENFLSINKKIKIAIGIEKWIDYSKDVYYYMNKSDPVWDETKPFDHGFPKMGQEGKIYVDRATNTYWKWGGRAYQQIKSIYDYEKDLVWFPLGVFVICQPSLSHTTGGCLISLSCKDKMCLLNGEMGGGLPTSVTFHEYDQIIGELVCNTDPRSDKELSPNSYTIYNYNGTYYSWTREYGWKEESDNSSVGEIVSLPQLIYDIIQTVVINFGGESASRIIINNVPKEIKQLVRYIGSAPLYHNIETGQYVINELYLTEEGTWVEYNFNEDIGYVYTDFVFPGQLITNIGDNVCSVLDKIISVLGNYEYFYDIDGKFVFQEIKNYLNTSYVPTEVENETQTYYLDNNRKFEIDTNSLKILGTDNYRADFCGDQQSIYTFEEGNNLITSYSNSPNFVNLKNDYHIWGKNSDGFAIHYHLVIKDIPTEMQTREVVFLRDDNGEFNGRIRLAKEDEVGISYTPNDWRAELYLQGLEVAKGGGRPDIYQQELLDLFDGIYEWGYYLPDGTFVYEGRFKTGVTNRPNILNYFIDYLEPVDKLYGIAVDDINPKLYTYQQDKIVRIYNNDVPDYIIIDQNMSNDYKISVIDKCDAEGQSHSMVESDVYSKFAIGTIGYSAQEVARDFLYQYTTYNESISLQCIPVYSLDVNRRITVKDKKSGINGDYVIKSMTVPLSPSSTMSITASRALNRI